MGFGFKLNDFRGQLAAKHHQRVIWSTVSVCDHNRHKTDRKCWRRQSDVLYVGSEKKKATRDEYRLTDANSGFQQKNCLIKPKKKKKTQCFFGQTESVHSTI